MNGGSRSIGATRDLDESAPFTVRAGELPRGAVQWVSVNSMANSVAPIGSVQSFDAFVNDARSGTLRRQGRLCCNDRMGDIEDIERIKYRYLRALDTKHWDEFADTLTEDVIGDYGESLGEEHHFTDRTSLVEFMRNAMPADVITEHRVTHPEIDVDGDEATGTWYLQDRVIVADFNFMLYGAAFYHDRYRRTPDGWRISATGYQRTYEVNMSTEAITNFKVKPGAALNI